jgi:signal transduction histidine kinase
MKSIRNKLITTYLCLAMLTVSVAGLLSFYLIIRNAKRMEREYCVVSAEGIVQQLNYVDLSNEKKLQEIADTAGFFQNVQVEILDSNKDTVIDSYSPQAGFFSFHFTVRNRNNLNAMDPKSIDEQLSRILEETREMKEEIEASTDINLDEYIILPKAVTVPKLQFQFQFPGGIPGQGNIFGRDRPSGLSDTESIKDADGTVIRPIGNPVNPRGYVAVTGGPDFTTQAKATARNALIIASIAAICIAILLGILIGNRFTNPIVSLSRAAGEMAKGNLDTRVRVRGKDEIGGLGKKFNTMAEKLKQSFTTISQERDVLKQFMQDASHHLRTPVTALTTFNELLLSQAGDDPEQREEFLKDSSEQLGRLDWIITKLLHLSRLDSQVVQPESSNFDAAELIENAWQSVYPIADRNSVSLESDISPDSVKIRGDRRWIETALANLFENAVLHSPRGGTVSVKIVSSEATGASTGGTASTAEASRDGTAPPAGMTEIHVRDRGPGIAPEDREHIFERFYRAQGNKGPGSGLGLAIVKSIAEAHGGTVTVISEPGKGSDFILRMPLDTKKDN